MAFKSQQLSITGAATAVPLLVQGSGAGQFKNIKGTLMDPIPCRIKNEDSANSCWIGGDTSLTNSNGASLGPGESMSVNLYGESEIPYVYCVTTLTVSVMLGRQ